MIHEALYRIFAALSLFIVNIFVGNLAWGVDDVALQEAFEAHGEVERAKVIHDRETGRSRGFGFVEMPNQEEAQAALEAMEGKELMGREIRCNESEARERRSAWRRREQPKHGAAVAGQREAFWECRGRLPRGAAGGAAGAREAQWAARRRRVFHPHRDA